LGLQLFNNLLLIKEGRVKQDKMIGAFDITFEIDLLAVDPDKAATVAPLLSPPKNGKALGV